MSPLFLVINPHAGGGRAGRLVPAMHAWAASRTAPITVHVAAGVPATLNWLNALPRGACVALVGGDGSVNQLLPAILANDLCLALIPQGSGNDVARALGVAGMRWREALDFAE